MLALIFFPFIASYIGNKPKRAAEGALWVFLIGTLFLPERTNIDFPLIPAIGKHQLAPMMAFVTLRKRDPGAFRRVRPFRGVELLMLLFYVAVFAQVPDNSDPIVWEAWPDPVVLSPLSYKESLSNMLAHTLTYWMPFYLGRVLVQSSADLRTYLKILVVSGFAYTFPSIVEQILSPQLHIWIYGFHQHDFGQTRRMGGWRPTIFLVHGLNVAMFMLTVATAAATLARVKERALKYAPKSLAVYQSVHVLLMKSTGAIIFGVATIPLAAFGKPRSQMAICFAFAAICVAYPGSKLQGVFPSEEIIHTVTQAVGAERAESLATRFQNDEWLTERARERFYFGWGGYGRMEIFNIWGQQISIPDAQWIILFGQFGISGVLAFFGMLLWPIFAAAGALKRIPDPTDRIILSGLSILAVTHAFDMLLNSMQNGFPMILSGALMGATEGLARAGRQARAGAVPAPPARRSVAV